MRKYFILTFLLAAQFILKAEHSLLTDTQKSHLASYQIDKNYLSSFPYNKYKVSKARGQGRFYIDKIIYKNRSKDTIKSLLKSGQAWEPFLKSIIKKYARPRSIALDIGSHIGTHTVTLSRAVRKKGLVIAFEPQWRIHRELCMNLKLNKCRNVIPIHCALGDTNGFVEYSETRNNKGGTVMQKGKVGK